MQQAQIDAAADRAREVVDGFKTIRMQQARDVLALADAISERDKAIDGLKKLLLAERLKAVGGSRHRSTFEDFFGPIFGGRQ